MHDTEQQTILALSHYWTMREQGKSPADAAAHARQRYGVVLDHAQIEDNRRRRAELLPSYEQPTQPMDVVAPEQRQITLRYGSEFTRTIIGTASTPSTPVGVNLS
jgi:hypothetical protein